MVLKYRIDLVETGADIEVGLDPEGAQLYEVAVVESATLL
jgi:hypothetical protein